jgi:hypothetical protein
MAEREEDPHRGYVACREHRENGTLHYLAECECGWVCSLARSSRVDAWLDHDGHLERVEAADELTREAQSLGLYDLDLQPSSGYPSALAMLIKTETPGLRARTVANARKYGVPLDHPA